MGRILDIVPLQEPFDLGPDDSKRAQIGFNILAMRDSSGSDEFIREVISILAAAGLGSLGTTIFASTKANIPTGSGPYLSVVVTGGLMPERIQNQARPAYQRPTAQIIARADRYQDAEARARAAYNALVVVRNQTVTI